MQESKKKERKSNVIILVDSYIYIYKFYLEKSQCNDKSFNNIIYYWVKKKTYLNTRVSIDGNRIVLLSNKNVISLKSKIARNMINIILIMSRYGRK